MTGLRVAILTHSTNPRCGVAHSLALAEALCALGHEAVVHAPVPDPGGAVHYRARGLGDDLMRRITPAQVLERLDAVTTAVTSGAAAAGERAP